MKASKPLLVLLAAAFLGLPAIVHSQTVTTAVPGFISYQGRVVDGSGNPVGSGTPVNRTVIFRIWSHPSNTLPTDLIYSEQQTVTVSEGEFSVLVGQGVAVASTAQFGYDETPKKLTDLGGAFTGSARYLGVTVDDGTATADNEITPRQQIVSTGFAFRSKFAETLGTSAGGTSLSVLDNGNIGVGNTNPPARFTISGTSTGTGTPQLILTDPADTNERLRIGMDNTGNGRGYIQAFKEGTGAQNLLLNPAGGNVGIGTLNPNRPLTIGSTDGIVVGDELTPSATSLSISLSAASNGYARLQSIKTQNFLFGDLILNDGGGNVGIGRNTTEAKLDILGQMKVDNTLTSPPGNGTMGSAGTRLVLWPGSATTPPYGFGINGGTLWSGVPVNSQHQWYIGTTNPMTLNSGGSLGIGTSTPVARLHVVDPGAQTGRIHVGGTAADNAPKLVSFGDQSYVTIGENGTDDQMQLDARTYSIKILGQNKIFIDSAGRIDFGNSGLNGATYGMRAIGSDSRITGMFNSAGTEVFQFWTDGGAFKPGGGSWAALSDARTKKNVTDITGALEKLMALRSVNFEYKEPAKHGEGRFTGFIAQEVEKVIPSWVKERDGLKTLEIRGFESLAVQALRELRTEKDGQIKALQSDVAEGEKKIAALEKRLADLEGADKARDAKLAAIEKMLAAAAKPAAGRTVALKKGSTAE